MAWHGPAKIHRARHKRKQQFFHDNPHCDACGKKLKWEDARLIGMERLSCKRCRYHVKRIPAKRVTVSAEAQAEACLVCGNDTQARDAFGYPVCRECVGRCVTV